VGELEAEVAGGVHAVVDEEVDLAERIEGCR
jgi:hypothetical protein